MSTQERTGVVTMQGAPLVLIGPVLTVGQTAPDFRVVDGAFAPVSLEDFAGKVLLITTVPSLDTGVCAKETKRFNDEVENLPSDVVVLTISTDLPFAQKRFCEAEKVSGVRTLSDHVRHSFGLHYGVLLKDMGLLARAVFVVDKGGTLVYQEIVPEVAHEPDCDAALEEARKAAK